MRSFLGFVSLAWPCALANCDSSNGTKTAVDGGGDATTQSSSSGGSSDSAPPDEGVPPDSGDPGQGESGIACAPTCTGTCSAPGCQIVVLASDSNGVSGLAVDSTSVYWTNYAGVQRVALGGGASELLSRAPFVSGGGTPEEDYGPSGIAADLRGAFWFTNPQLAFLCSPDSEVRSLALDGGADPCVRTDRSPGRRRGRHKRLLDDPWHLGRR